MTRRELVKKTVGALFGVSVIPAALEKPKAIHGMDPSFKIGSDRTLVWPTITHEQFKRFRNRLEFEEHMLRHVKLV